MAEVIFLHGAIQSKLSINIRLSANKFQIFQNEIENGQIKAIINIDNSFISDEILRQAGGKLSNWVLENDYPNLNLDIKILESENADSMRSFFVGIVLGAFRFNSYKSKASEPKEIRIGLISTNSKPDLEAVFNRALIIGNAQNLARDWGHEPPNIINPVTLAAKLEKFATENNLRYQVFDDKQLEAIGAEAIVAVGKGSHTPSRMIILEYPGNSGVKNQDPIVVVGKTITFDTGGYTIKTRDGMLGMKYDKCGGMAVIGIMQAVSQLKIKNPVIGIIAAAENMITGHSYRPNDIITTLSGKTVEIISADAEGRMVLADALSYACQQYRPRSIIDLATLTGGVGVALGKTRAGLMSNNQALANDLFNAGERTFERLWQLPLDDEYVELIKGDDSDLKNSGGRQASAIIGGIFLKQFVNENYPWAHIDIASTGNIETSAPYCPKGATGFGVRLIVDYLEKLEI